VVNKRQILQKEMYIIYHKHIDKKFPGLQEFEAPRFQNSRYMKVVMLSAVHTGRLYPKDIILALISVMGQSAEGLGQ